MISGKLVDIISSQVTPLKNKWNIVLIEHKKRNFVTSGQTKCSYNLQVNAQ